jgi:hypothetical protein
VGYTNNGKFAGLEFAKFREEKKKKRNSWFDLGVGG